MSDRKAAGYYSSFVNFVGQTPQSENKNKDDDDDDEDATKNSDDASMKRDRTDKDKVAVSRPNTAKRGRLRGPKCARKRLAKNSDDSSGSPLPSENEKESDDEASAARHVPAAKTSKLKVVQRG